jgi:putative flippase GtrA
MVRFIIVGLFNTGLNFAVLNFAFYVLHQNKIVAGIIATACAIVLSFFLNRNFVFHSHGSSWRQPVVFVAVTVTGVLLVQNMLYIASIFILKSHPDFFDNLIYGFTKLHFSPDFIQVNVSNAFGSLGAMVWNYNGYKWFVFKGHAEEVIDDINLPA